MTAIHAPSNHHDLYPARSGFRAWLKYWFTVDAEAVIAAGHAMSHFYGAPWMDLPPGAASGSATARPVEDDSAGNGHS